MTGVQTCALAIFVISPSELNCLIMFPTAKGEDVACNGAENYGLPQSGRFSEGPATELGRRPGAASHKQRQKKEQNVSSRKLLKV